jgi:DNA-binding response OmpR family regulator
MVEHASPLTYLFLPLIGVICQPLREREMSDKLKLLAVDDEPYNLEILQHYLEGSYELILANNGEEGLEVLAKHDDIEMVLLDVSMPDMDGYQVCQRIRENNEWDHISVVFISARGAIEDRMLGYQSGGDEYLVKPFECDELLAKIKLLEKFKQEKKGLEDNYQMASSVAMEAMTNSQEIGLALEFSKETYAIRSESDLMDLFVNCLKNFGLNAIIRLKINDDYQFHQCIGEPSPLEKGLVEILSKKDRIFSFEHRTQFNFDRINLLVKNMPIEDENKYGRYKDLLPFFLDATNACMESIEDRKTISDNDKLKSVIFQINEAMDSERNLIKESQTILKTILEDLNRTVEDVLPTLGLEYDQEKFLIQLIEGKILEASVAADISNKSDALFNQVGEFLTELNPQDH